MARITLNNNIESIYKEVIELALKNSELKDSCLQLSDAPA
jgi:hypothetical protein